MPQESHRDHGVAEGAHWLLDEGLAPYTRTREPDAHLPRLLRHEAPVETSLSPSATPLDEHAPRNFLVFMAALVGALSLSVLFRGVDVSAGEAQAAREGEDRTTVVTATFAGEPRAGQIGTLRRTQGSRAETIASGSRAVVPAKPAAPEKTKQPKPPPPPGGLLPPLPPPPVLPPPPAPLPLPIPDLVHELPDVTLPPLPDAPTLEGL